VDDLIKVSFSNCLDDVAVLHSQEFVARVFGLTVNLVCGVWNGMLADALSLDEYLRLEEFLRRTRFALHVVDGVIDSNVGIKTEDHFAGTPGLLAILSIGLHCHFAETTGHMQREFLECPEKIRYRSPS
jgi:hypothetical protein